MTLEKKKEKSFSISQTTKIQEYLMFPDAQREATVIQENNPNNCHVKGFFWLLRWVLNQAAEVQPRLLIGTHVELIIDGVSTEKKIFLNNYRYYIEETQPENTGFFINTLYRGVISRHVKSIS